MKEYIHLKINGVDVTAEKGQTILEAARSNSIDIPTLCNDERVAPYGACGMCVVEIEGSPKLSRACATVAGEGMVIKTETPKVNRARKFALQMLLSDHTGDCKAPCSLACPAGTDCQGYVGLIANGEINEAVNVIKNKIPLPASIGRVCPHPCEKKCRRGLVDEPIAIASLKAYAADKVLDACEKQTDFCLPSPTGKNVAVIGGGPGGLSAAYYLALKGHAVTVYDMMPEMGGMLRYGIPQYRLPKEILDREISLIEKAGVKFKNNVKIGSDITLDKLRGKNDAVIIAVGAWKSAQMRVKGEALDGVFGGIDFLRGVILGSAPDIGERVAICGGGNTAMDACRTAVRLGAKEVYVIYRRTRDEMPADQLEIEEAIEEGVTFKFLTNPDEILEENGKVCGMRLQVMELGEPDSSGRRKPVPIEGKFENIALDSVIMAIGQKSALDGFESVELTDRGTISADESTFRTNLDGVFAIGDVTNKGASIAVAAIGEAQKSAEVIDSYLNGILIGYKKPILVERKLTAEDFKDRERIMREKMKTLSPENRKHNFDEVALGFTDEQAKNEASRCLECGCLEYYRCKLVGYANEYSADYSKYSGEKSTAEKDGEHPFIIRDSGKCILCSLCVRVCSEVMGTTAIGLAGRGFSTVVSPEFYDSLNNSKCISCGQCVSLCPTGALTQKVPFKKDVPLEASKTLTHCVGCANLCAITVSSSGNIILRTEPTDGKTLCSEGRMGFSETNSPARLKTAIVNGEETSVELAVSNAANKIKTGESESIAVCISENMTDGEIIAARKLAEAIGTHYFINLGNSKKHIKEADVDTYKNLFGDNLDIGANRSTAERLGAQSKNAVDLSQMRTVIALGGIIPKTSDRQMAICQSTVYPCKEEADVLLPLATAFETDGYLNGDKKLTKIIEPASGYSNEDIINGIIKMLK